MEQLTLQQYISHIEYGEEETVITLDMPAAPPTTLQVSEAQTTKLGVQQITTSKAAKLPRFDYLINTCRATQGGRLWGANAISISPAIVMSYLPIVSTEDELAIDKTTKILQLPKYGKLYKGEEFLVSNQYKSMIFNYLPNKDFQGDDKVIFATDYKGKHYKIVVKLRVRDEIMPDGRGEPVSQEKLCPNAYEPKRIKLNDISNELTSPYAQLYLPNSDVTITFRDLVGSAVGETIGEGADATITLDTDAAGYGWYTGGMFGLGGLNLDADFTQGMLDMTNWLPTSNPNEWVARAGTEAAGKMDMLSVLLHEYGHALGIEHSHDAHNYMATTLTPGMRRLPSAGDMQLMAQLAAEAREAIMAGQDYVLDLAQFGGRE